MRASLSLGIFLVSPLAWGAAPVAPTLTQQPAHASVIAPAAATFKVIAKGSAPLTYQWERSTDGGVTFGNLTNGGGFAGATTAALKVSLPTLAMNGHRFRCRVTNGAGSVTSNVASLAVNFKPTITLQPAAWSTVAGSGATFKVTAEGSPVLGYQWKKNGAVLAGQTTDTLAIGLVKASDAAAYTVTITNPYGTITSKAAKLTVTVPPAITVQPGNAAVVAPVAATFKVTATGTAPLTYQWERSTDKGASYQPLANGGGIAGATTTTLKVSPSNLAQNGQQFRCVVNNVTAQPATSNSATLGVGAKPAITTPPAGRTVVAGAAATFNVTATGTPSLTYQWKKNGVALAGQTADSLKIASVVASDAASYTVIVANAYGSVTSAAAKLSVGLLPSITQQPANAMVTGPAPATFTVTATGTATLAYQWQKSTDDGASFVNLANGAGFVGVATKTLKVSPTNVAMRGLLLRCLVTNPVGATPSNAATLLVDARPAITTPPIARGAPIGDSTTFTVTASGTALNYQWKKDGAAIPGATSADYTVPSASLADIGNYSVTVSNNLGSVTSPAAALRVGHPPVILTDPLGVEIWGQATFSVTAVGDAPLLYQWQMSTDGGLTFTDRLDNDNLTGANDPNFNILTVPESMDGHWVRCVVTNSISSAISGTALLTVKKLGSPPFTLTVRAPAATVSPQNTYFFGLATNSTMIVAVGFNATSATPYRPLVETSPDGVSWTQSAVPGAGGLYGVAWGAGKYVAVGQAGLIVTSPDGVNWTQRTSGIGQDLTGVQWTGTQFVAVSYRRTQEQPVGRVLSSPDGVTWTLRAALPTIALFSVVSRPGIYFAAGAGINFSGGFFAGAILSSTDLINWTTRLGNLRAEMYDLDYGRGSGRYVAVGDLGLAAISTTGLTWTMVNPGIGTNWLYKVNYVGNQFIAAGGYDFEGIMIISPDGLQWANHPVPAAVAGIPLRTMLTLPSGNFIVAGASGVIMTGTPNFAKITSTDSASTFTSSTADKPQVLSPALGRPDDAAGENAAAINLASALASLHVLDPASPVQIVHGQNHATVTTALSPDAGIHGAVRDAAGEAVAGAMVYAYATIAGAKLAVCDETDTAGRFYLAVLAGEWQVGTLLDPAGAEKSVTVLSEGAEAVYFGASPD